MNVVKVSKHKIIGWIMQNFTIRIKNIYFIVIEINIYRTCKVVVLKKRYATLI